MSQPILRATTTDNEQWAASSEHSLSTITWTGYIDESKYIRSHFEWLALHTEQTRTMYWLSPSYSDDRHSEAKSQYIVSARTRIDEQFFALICLPFSFAKPLSSEARRIQSTIKGRRREKIKSDEIIAMCLMVINIIFTLSNRKCQQNPVRGGLRTGSIAVNHTHCNGREFNRSCNVISWTHSYPVFELAHTRTTHTQSLSLTHVSDTERLTPRTQKTTANKIKWTRGTADGITIRLNLFLRLSNYQNRIGCRGCRRTLFLCVSRIKQRNNESLVFCYLFCFFVASPLANTIFRIYVHSAFVVCDRIVVRTAKWLQSASISALFRIHA